MLKKKELESIILDSSIKWEEDSKKEKWDNFYIPFYKSKYDKIVCFDELTYTSGKYYRVVAMTKKLPIIEQCTFGGDVIINLDNVPEADRDKLIIKNKYSNCNLGLLPKEGNLQGGKKKLGNDWEIHKFLKAINSFYVDNNDTILVMTKNRNNRELTIRILDFLACKISDGKVEKARNDDAKIYNFCENLYGINEDLVSKFLHCDDVNDYYKLLNEFWRQRTRLKNY